MTGSTVQQCPVIMNRVTALHKTRWTVIVMGTVNVMEKSHINALAAELNSWCTLHNHTLNYRI